jgi:hypothetical protein
MAGIGSITRAARIDSIKSAARLDRIKKAVRIDEAKEIADMYRLIRKLSAINGPKADKPLLDRVMYGSEALPPLGKEYWWLMFFGRDGERPVQLMLLIFRKHGKRMLFNGREMSFKKLGEKKFRAVTAGWIYDGKKLRDLGDTNAVVEISGKRIVSEISGQRMVLSGGFPDYRLKVGKAIDLRVRRGDYLEDRDAYGILIPPFGMGWIDVFSEAEGTVLGKRFRGAAHLQKVFGVTIFGPFHWGRVVFEGNSVASFFSVKTGKRDRKNFCLYLLFYDKKRNEIIRFKRPKLKVSKTGDGWVVEGRDRDKEFRMVLEPYAKKEFTMKGGGSQAYVEYAVTAKEFRLKTKDREITLENLGKGVGSFEDAYW